jgi:hypothetical protein
MFESASAAGSRSAFANRYRSWGGERAVRDCRARPTPSWNARQSHGASDRNGELAELTARQLVKRGVKEVSVLGRAVSNAERLADYHGVLLSGEANAVLAVEVPGSSAGLPAAKQPVALD